jgi:hypothetical protein
MLREIHPAIVFGMCTRGGNTAIILRGSAPMPLAGATDRRRSSGWPTAFASEGKVEGHCGAIARVHACPNRDKVR